MFEDISWETLRRCLEAMTDAKVTIRIIGKTKPLKQWDAMRELRRRIRNRFDKEGI